MSKKRGIIFDLDGTVVDSLPGIKASIIYAIRKQGHEIEDNVELRSLIGPPIKFIVEKLLTRFGDDRVNSTVEIYREHYREIGLYKSSAYALMRETLLSFKDDGYDLYIATSKRQAFTEEVLRTVNLQNVFLTVQGTPDDGTLDDKSDLLRHLIISAMLDCHELVLVGDRENDVIAAHANKMPAIGALWGYGSERELNEASVDALCRTPVFLQEIVQQFF